MIEYRLKGLENKATANILIDPKQAIGRLEASFYGYYLFLYGLNDQTCGIFNVKLAKQAFSMSLDSLWAEK